MIKISRSAWIFTFLMYLAAVAYLCFGYFDSLGKLNETLLNIPTDKVAHFLMFFPFVILLYACINAHPSRISACILLVLISAVSGLAVSAASELLQNLTDYRQADPMDFAADALAVGISSIFVFIFETIRIKRQNG